MFKSTALIAALLACVAITPAQATSVENGLKANGMRVNGVRLNGPLLQGIRLNGLRVNGVELGATIEAIRLIAIELPQ